MLDFDVLLGIDWLHACFASIYISSCLKSCRIVYKGYLYPILRVKDFESKILPLELVPVVRDYQKVFPDDLPGIPPEQELDFGIDLLADTEPISIPPCRMTPTELKKLKLQLKDLLDKGFIK